MSRLPLLPTACAAAALLSAPALADNHVEPVPAAVQAELEALRTRVETLEALVERLTGTQAETAARAAAAEANAEAAAETASETAAAVAAQPRVTMGAAPRTRTSDGWDFRPFGRIQFDAAHVDGPDGYIDSRLGFGSELRRGRIGMRGSIPGGFGYKIEVDFADNDVTLTDVLISYDAGDGFELTAGQHNNFQSLEELTSSRFTSFMERAAFTDAFGFERRVGFSAAYESDDLLVAGGVFTANIDDLIDSSNSNVSADARIVYAPEVNGTQLHFGGSAHIRNLSADAGIDIRYRQRPAVHTTDTRFIATDLLAVDDETSFGLEAAVINGRFHAVAEAHWLTPDLVAQPDPTFFGGYAEVGFFLTDDSRGYSGGRFDRTRPSSPVGDGGIGAVQLNARYDRLDLSDGMVSGGEQDLFGLSLIWTPIAHARLLVNYSHIRYDDAAVVVGTDDDYSVDVIGGRAEIDF